MKANSCYQRYYEVVTLDNTMTGLHVYLTNTDGEVVWKMQSVISVS